jgi:hypothetical protein
MLSAVDNRGDTRLLDDVLDHAPTHEASRALLGRLTTALSARALPLLGVTTEGAARSPEPRLEVLGDVPHHIGALHLVAAVAQAVVGAVASARTALAATPPTWGQGRPSPPAAKPAARTQKPLAAQGAALCASRPLCIPRHRNQTARKPLGRVSRGLPQLQALRASMEQVSALCERRCRPQTALHKLAQWRRRLLRFTQVGATLKKRFAPTLAKALPCLDDQLLPSPSKAGERGNRRDRKRQKQVSRVRTQGQSSARLALDRWREAHAEGRQQTLASLHCARAG